MDFAKTTARGYRKHWNFGIWCDLYGMFYGMCYLWIMADKLGQYNGCLYPGSCCHRHHRECLNNSIFFNLMLCAACWAHSVCHHELWPISVSHPFSSLNSSLGLTGGKYYQKITVSIFRLVLQNFSLLGCFPYILSYSYLFSLLPSGWFVIAVCGCISVREPVK